jgi:dTDP-glucose 4,6-dehydratase
LKYNILVTGGSGFIGKNFILELIKKKNFNIYSLSQKKIKKKFQYKEIKYIFCKIQNKSQLKKELNFKLDFVVNFAGHSAHNEKKKTYDTHYLGLKNLAEIMLTKKIKKFIQIGSSVEYGFIKSPQKEEKEYNLNKLESVYGKSKLKSTNYLKKLYKKFNFPSLILRPYLVYGPGQNLNRLIPATIINCFKNNSFNSSSGKQVRNFIYVKDFSKIIYKCLFLRINEQILNVGSLRNYKVKFIINKINKLINKGFPQYGQIKLRRDELLNLYPDLSKLNKYIKLNNQTTIEDGLKKTISYFKKLNNEKNLPN